jgi:hypothetical protein
MCPVGEMDLNRVVVLLGFLCVISIVKSCTFNDCICGNGVVICETTDETEPYFSSDELIETEQLEITNSQRIWFEAKCDSFPRLQGVLFRDKTSCPSHTCVTCL